MRNKNLLVYVILFSILAAAATRYRNLTIQSSTVDSSPVGSIAPSTGVFTVFGIGTGIDASKTGFKHVRVTSCTTAAVANAGCNTTVNWPGTPFTDTNYTAGCSLNDVSSAGAAMDYGTGTKTTTTIVTGIINTPGNAIAVNGQLNCWAVHDAP